MLNFIRSFFFLLFLFSLSSSYSQHFEGSINYKIKYTSKSSLYSVEFLEQEYGSESTLFVKDGFYKEITNSNFMQFQLFRFDTKKIYYTNKNDNDTLRIISSASKANNKFEIEIRENVGTVLNHKCNQLIYKDNNGKKIYTYSSNYSLDPSFYSSYTRSNKDEIMKMMKAIYLKLEMENDYFKIEVIATKINRHKIADKEFNIPEYTALLVE